ncbi:MAG TPA: hypothetical protein VNM89_07545 [Solirubrobacterales bacterium]|nr:hypothetical protein [Solirubrobacterales bacterium]
MVELEDQGISLPAIHAGVLSKERNEKGRALFDHELPPLLRIVDVALAVRGVVLLLICRSARSAVVVALPF